MAETKDKSISHNGFSFSSHNKSNKCLEKCLNWNSLLIHKHKAVIQSSQSQEVIKYKMYYNSKNPLEEVLSEDLKEKFFLIDEVKEKLKSENLPDNNEIILPIILKKTDEFEKNILRFLVEIDVDCKENKEKMYFFKCITPQYSHYNFEFKINARCHNTQIFNEDISFKLDGYFIVKSIQSRLEKYRSMVNSKILNFPTKSSFIVPLSDSVSALISSNLLGSIEKYQSNVFNIMNSEFTINKILFEIKFPYSMITPSNDFNLAKSRISQMPISSFIAKSRNLQKIPIEYIKSSVPIKSNKFDSNSTESQNVKLIPSNDQFKMDTENRQINNNFIFSNGTNLSPFPNSQSKCFYYGNVNISPNINNYFNVNNSQSYLNFFPVQSPQKIIHQNISNFHIFMTSVTPVILETDDISIQSILNSFERISILGLDTMFIYKGQKILTNYSPTLSSLNIEMVNQNETTDNSYLSSNSRMFIRSQSKKQEFLNVSNFENSTAYLSNSSVESLFSAISDDLSIEKLVSTPKRKNYQHPISQSTLRFSEERYLHLRPCYKQKIEEIFNQNPELADLTISDISDNSYFSILWTPLKTLNFVNNNTSFLVYYSFRNKTVSNSIKSLSVIGVLSIKNIDSDFWFSNQVPVTPYISIDNFSKLRTDFRSNFNQFQQLSQSAQILVNFNKDLNYDYNFLLK